MKKKRFVLVGLVGLLSGCNASTKMNRLSVGMEKQEVLKVMGEPYYTGAQGKMTFMTYKLEDQKVLEAYFVRLEDGRVESFGKLGDFDSTKNPTNDVNLTVRRMTDGH